MQRIALPITLGLLTLLIVGCGPRLLMKPYDLAKVQRLYSDGVGDAAKPQPWEISNQLVAITPENGQLVWKEFDGEKYLLVSSWKEDTIFYKNDEKTGKYNTGNYPIWVTAAPQLQDVCRTPAFGRKEGLDFRLKQLLGLPPNVEKKYFVEFWVRAQDVFRPCPDAEISDSNCELAFPETATDDHKTWINDLRLTSYYNSKWDRNYPWTELGYTYDWNPKNKTRVGMSEFVIGKNKNIIVHGFHTTEAYCALSKK
ncbi:hypothetical protein [Flavilitoribacter nigricans]|uniref:Lipoprotein n=1 Tax=Flavilitoribacter nigricans (strain ATCC 23147 / DSM 23189 / NBRC 102662 / NCIMB 1420 / SS-2) TaxID=1122177 RepID=A0A2D0NC92_FLAN2|nr:hypothetical protein [Flavilitoribacter nigricans]PHN05383.1 hypothetical protein CRP01_17885 [Flavilitoribacter nigricans DSM 23189 = NBRC 102662]